MTVAKISGIAEMLHFNCWFSKALGTCWVVQKCCKDHCSGHQQTWAAFLLCRGTPDFENFPDLLPYINKVIIHLLQDQSFSFYTGWCRGPKLCLKKTTASQWWNRPSLQSVWEWLSFKDTGGLLYACTCRLVYACTQCSYTCKQTCKQTCMCMCACRHARTQAHTLTLSLCLTHAHTHSHTHTHTHTGDGCVLLLLLLCFNKDRL